MSKFYDGTIFRFTFSSTTANGNVYDFGGQFRNMHAEFFREAFRDLDIYPEYKDYFETRTKIFSNGIKVSFRNFVIITTEEKTFNAPILNMAGVLANLDVAFHWGYDVSR